ncbi:uncharacterized protein BJX67DRAFT_287570 [Aspergillus lucknowensis]|uniref:Uncharacterized protein n=1 Tax=Aspergillus lucknowensis TaxID=176173 RepID=A0ABR4LEG4_9EURO
MKLPYATIFLGFCGAVLAIPTSRQRGEKRLFLLPPFLSPPGEGTEPGEPEPELPYPSFPFPSDYVGPSESTGLPRYLPRPTGVNERCGEPPLDRISELEESLPWEQLNEEEDGREGQGPMMEDEDVPGEEDAEETY